MNTERDWEKEIEACEDAGALHALAIEMAKHLRWRKGVYEALTEMAAFSDSVACSHLEKTGSYGAFDEPGSVQIARKLLEMKP